MNYTAETMLVKSKDTGKSGAFASITAEQAGWQHLNMVAVRLNKGEKYTSNTGGHEQVSVILGGRCKFISSAGTFKEVGERPNVFAGMPWAVYSPHATAFEIEALTDNFEVAICKVSTDEEHPAKLITPQDCAMEIRGGGNATRQINSIVPPGFDCQRIVAVEVYTPPGNWSSYPPHKHDVHKVDENGNLLEADLEEIYFYKMDKPGGYAYQRVYNDSRSIDAVMMAQQHDMVLVPEGYHPVVSAHGFTTYYLNFLAGSAQSLANSDDPEFAWIKSTWTEKDPRVPVVYPGMKIE